MVIMNNKNFSHYPVLLLIWILTLGVSYVARGQVMIKGTVRGFEDGTKVILADTRNGEALDSTIIYNESFKFSIAPMDTIMRGVFIDNKTLNPQGNELVVFFVEDVDIRIQGLKGSLKYSEVSGGIVQNQYEAYKKLIEEDSRRYDEVNALSFEAYENKDRDRLDSLSKVLDRISESRLQTTLKYINEHPSQFVSLLKLETLIPLITQEQLAESFQDLDASLRRHRSGKYIESVINRNILALKEVAPEFVLKDMGGNKVSLSQYRGSYVLIDFWASWCASCRLDNAEILKTHEQYGMKDFEVISVSLDEDLKKWKRASEKDGISWVNLINESGSTIVDDYNVLLIPTNYLLGPEGEIIAVNLRGKKLRAKLEEILKP